MSLAERAAELRRQGRIDTGNALTEYDTRQAAKHHQEQLAANDAWVISATEQAQEARDLEYEGQADLREYQNEQLEQMADGDLKNQRGREYHQLDIAAQKRFHKAYLAELERIRDTSAATIKKANDTRDASNQRIRATQASYDDRTL